MSRDGSKCVLSGIEIVSNKEVAGKRELGIASHVLKKSEINTEKIPPELSSLITNEYDPKTTILLTKYWDSLFSKGMWAVKDDRETIVLSSDWDGVLPEGVTKLRKPTDDSNWPPKEFFAWHRKWCEDRYKRKYQL